MYNMVAHAVPPNIIIITFLCTLLPTDIPFINMLPPFILLPNMVISTPFIQTHFYISPIYISSYHLQTQTYKKLF